MKLSDLVTGPDGKASHTKLWNNVGGTVMTSIVLHQHFVLGKLSDDLLVWYAGLLIAGVIANKAANALPGAK